MVQSYSTERKKKIVGRRQCILVWSCIKLWFCYLSFPILWLSHHRKKQTLRKKTPTRQLKTEHFIGFFTSILFTKITRFSPITMSATGRFGSVQDNRCIDLPFLIGGDRISLTQEQSTIPSLSWNIVMYSYLGQHMLERILRCVHVGKHLMIIIHELKVRKLMCNLMGLSWHFSRDRNEMFYLMTHSTHFIYGYMASDIW